MVYLSARCVCLCVPIVHLHVSLCRHDVNVCMLPPPPIGMSKHDVDVFRGKLDKALAKFVKKHSHHLPPTQPPQQGGGAGLPTQPPLQGGGADQDNRQWSGHEGDPPDGDMGGATGRGEGLEEAQSDEESPELLSTMTKELQLSN